PAAAWVGWTTWISKPPGAPTPPGKGNASSRQWEEGCPIPRRRGQTTGGYRGATCMKKHLLQAAERGDAEAQFNLGIMYENGLDNNRYVIEGNRPEAV